MNTGTINPQAKKLLQEVHRPLSISVLIDQIKNKNIVALARAITIIENTLPEEKKKAATLLSSCRPKKNQSIRIGITGAPGVGKSSFIESFVLELISKHPKARIAILTIDPISPLKGGSILGDKTRMQSITSLHNVFIRPSPSSHSSELHNTTSQTIQLCEYAGYDYILIETVGVGQSDIGIYDLVDITLLLINPATGDELQGIKKGINEIADLIIINKDDGLLQASAKTTQAEYLNATKLLNMQDKIQILRCSSIERKGIAIIWEKIDQLIDKRKKSKEWSRYRSKQLIRRTYQSLENNWIELLKNNITSKEIIDLALEKRDKEKLLKTVVRRIK